MRSLFFILFCSLISCGPGDVDKGQSQGFYNDTDHEIFFYLHLYEQNGKYFPAYDSLTDKPNLLSCPAYRPLGIWTPSPASIYKYGVQIHAYAFAPDTLSRYSWEDVLSGKKYWFVDTECSRDAIVFPDDFHYIGDL